jgi:hypothetical protein
MRTNALLRATFVATLLSSTSVFAAATTEEAASITASMQTYMGSEPGVITVTPDGDGYDIAIDIAPYLKKVTVPGFAATVDPLRFTATPGDDDGEWSIESEGAYSAVVKVPGIYDMDLKIGDISWEGTYDESIFSFTESKYSLKDIAITQTNIDPSIGMTTRQTTTIASVEGGGTSEDAGNGLADSEGTTTITNLSSAAKFDVPPELAGAGMPKLDYSANVATVVSKSAIKGVSAKPIMELAHPNRELIIKDQAILKEKLLAALPLFGSLSSEGTYDTITFETGFGQFAMAKAAVDVTLNGAVKDGRFGEGISVTDLKLPDTLPLPPWSKGLIPTSFDLGFDLSGFDMEAPARKFITEMDVSKDEPVPPGSEMAYLAALAPGNTIKITIPPGKIASSLYTLTYEAVVDASLGGAMPKVAGKITMTGMDQVTAQLSQAATDPMAQQALAGLFAAKGMAKAEGDTLVWDITMGENGRLMVNTTDLSTMLGLPPPQPAQ